MTWCSLLWWSAAERRLTDARRAAWVLWLRDGLRWRAGGGARSLLGGGLRLGQPQPLERQRVDRDDEARPRHRQRGDLRAQHQPEGRLEHPRRDRERDGVVADRPAQRSEEHTSELQSHHDIVCRILL